MDTNVHGTYKKINSSRYLFNIVVAVWCYFDTCVSYLSPTLTQIVLFSFLVDHEKLIQDHLRVEQEQLARQEEEDEILIK